MPERSHKWPGIPGLRSPGRQVLLTNGEGTIIAALRHAQVATAEGIALVTVPVKSETGRRLLDVFGPAQPLTTFGAAAGVLEIQLADGSSAYATVHSLAIGRR